MGSFQIAGRAGKSWDGLMDGLLHYRPAGQGRSAIAMGRMAVELSAWPGFHPTKSAY
jgi:hypothetical protein